MVIAPRAFPMLAVSFSLAIAMASAAHGQVETTISDTGDEIAGADMAGDDPTFTEPAKPGHRTASPSLYISEPDVERCASGTLRSEARSGFITTLNAERAHHGLGSVGYDAASDDEATAAALIMAANGALSHEPSPSWKCWSASGARGAGSSNLLLNMTSDVSFPANDTGLVAQWLIEGGGDELGHRRWLLDPYLTRTALGRVTQVLPDGSRIDAAVMKVFDLSGEGPWPAQVPEFIAWPQGDYPRSLFSPAARLSFTVVTGTPGSAAAAGVDFSRASVTVSDGGSHLRVSALQSDNEAYGVANCLSWRVAGLQSGRRYEVTISGVAGAPRSRYDYDFTIEPA